MRKLLNYQITPYIPLLILVSWLVLTASYFGSGPRTITPSVGTPGFVQANEAHQTTSVPLPVSFGALPSINHIVMVGTVFQGAGTFQDLALTVTDNQGNSYSRVAVQSSGGGTNGVISWWCTVVTVSSGTYTVTADSAAAGIKGIFILEYGSTSCNPDKSAGANSGTSPYNCGSITTKNAKDLLLSLLIVVPGATGTVTFTAPTGFTTRQSFGVAASGIPMAAAEQVVSAVGTYAPTFGASQNLASSQCMTVAMISQ